VAARVEQRRELLRGTIAASDVRTFVRVAESTIALPLNLTGLDPVLPIR